MAAPAAAFAGEGDAAALGGWIIQLAAVLVVASSLVSIYSKLRTNPPAHRQFAPIDHQHAGVLTKGEQESCREAHTREMMTIRQEMGGLTGKLERQMDHLRNAITTQNDQLMAQLDKYNEHSEDRVRRMHQRLDPLPSAIAANTRSIETHLADHRAGKA